MNFHDLRDRVSASPFHHSMGMTLDQAEESRAVMRLELQQHHLSADGIVHGGVTAALIDSSSWYGIAALAAGETTLRTAQLSVHFLRPAQGRALIAHASVIHLGHSMAVAQTSVSDDAAQLVAVGSITASLTRT